jgi:hypothetical protein
MYKLKSVTNDGFETAEGRIISKLMRKEKWKKEK